MEAIKVAELFKGKVKKLGIPDDPNPMNRPWETGIFKRQTDESVYLTETGLDGDEVGDKVKHGGPEKALFAYPISHYEYWQQEEGLDVLDVGAFGENLALSSSDETEVCIGDTYTFGEAIIQVSQPRQPCWRPARRFKIVDLALRIQKSRRTGWYFRVLREGYVQGGDSLHLLDRPEPKWTIDACNCVMHVQKKDLTLAASLASSPYLAENWKNTLEKRLKGKQSSVEKRVYGPNKD